MLVLLAVFSALVYFTLSRSLNAAVDTSLAVSASQVVDGLEFQDGQIVISDTIRAGDREIRALRESGLTFLIRAQDGRSLLADGPYSTTKIPIPAVSTSAAGDSYVTLPDSAEENLPIRVYSLPLMENGRAAGWVQVIQSLDQVEDALEGLVKVQLIGGGLMLILAALGAYLLTTHALRPIDGITRVAQQIAGGDDLSARLGLPDTGDEVSRLAATFDGMLVRLENSFQRERQFTADASHELRTPLAAMQSILGVVRERERPVSEYHQALNDLNEETNHLRGLTEDLLRLARGEDKQSAARERVALSDLLTDVVDSLRPLAEARGLGVRAGISEGLVLDGDTDALIRLFVNLVDNAIKYTEHGQISVTAHRDGPEIIVEIADTGIGIPPQHLPHIFDRFYRVDPARSNAGAGLGLAIARQISESHGGRLEVQSRPGEGSTFTVHLPG